MFVSADLNENKKMICGRLDDPCPHYVAKKLEESYSASCEKT